MDLLGDLVLVALALAVLPDDEQRTGEHEERDDQGQPVMKSRLAILVRRCCPRA